jgi:hypothetical protein
MEEKRLSSRDTQNLSMIQTTVRQLLAGAFSRLSAEKKQSHFWLCFEWRVGFKILF